MNKLIIAVAIVCVAVVTQAASVAWSSNNMSLTDKDGKALNTTDALANVVLVNLGSTIQWDDVTVIPTGDGSGQTTMTINTATISKGGRLSGKVTFNYAGEGADLINNNDYLALMVKDGDSYKQLTYTSGDDKGKAVDAVYQVTELANNGSNVSQKPITMSGNFMAQSVPEPTSAMLLLLGVAGLALRRRRA